MKYKTIIVAIVFGIALVSILTVIISNQINKANSTISEVQKEPIVILDEGVSGKKYNMHIPDKATYKELYDKCVLVQKWSEDMVQFMDDLKKEMILIADGPNTEAIEGDKIYLAKLAHKDDYDTPTKFMVGDSIKKGKAYLLHTKFSQYHKSLLSIMSPKDTLSYTDSLRSELDDSYYIDEEEPELNGWEKHIFHHTPMAAAIAHLSKLQGDIRHDESVVINYFFMKSK